MAFDGFVKLDGVAGESLDQRHKDWIEIVAYNFGVNQSTSASASSNGGAGSEMVTGEGCYFCGGPLRLWGIRNVSISTPIQRSGTERSVLPTISIMESNRI